VVLRAEDDRHDGVGTNFTTFGFDTAVKHRDGSDRQLIDRPRVHIGRDVMEVMGAQNADSSRSIRGRFAGAAHAI